MEILQHIWGATPEGEAIVIYTIRNANGCEVQLCNIGAAIVSVKAPDRNGNIDDIVLGYKDAMSYFGDGAASGKSVGRVANRIAKGKMTVDGVEYMLEINNGPNHLHGGSKGFANQLWDSRVAKRSRCTWWHIPLPGLEKRRPCFFATVCIYLWSSAFSKPACSVL